MNSIPERLTHAFRLPVTRALLALMLIVCLGAIFNADGAFFKWGTHRDMLRGSSVYAILACGMTIVIISGGIDLSVASVLALTAVVFSILTIRWSWSPWLAIPACLAVGSACGAVSGSLIARFSIQPFIATLAMMVFASGLAKYVSGGEKIFAVVRNEDGGLDPVDLPAIFDMIDSRILGGNLTVVTVIFLICLLVCWVLMTWLQPGRYVFAVGGNEEAAKLSGVPVGIVKLLAYGMSGFFSAVAGICQAAQAKQGDPETGLGYELNAIAIVVIGGTNLSGGRGSVLLTLVGVLIIGYLDKILSINAVGDAGRDMLTGVIIVGAVLMQRGKR
ncbi:MAG: ABC transporter permease [bacterium]|nr:ABC transporter permease [bacterium]